jgi:hypothetical protein
MSKMSGWQKAGLIAGAGCFSIVAIVLVGLLIAVTRARSIVSEFGDTEPASIDRTIALGSTTPIPADKAGAAGPVEPLQLTVDLEEGIFTVKPGPPGADVQVQGTYAPGLYELTETKDASARRATIRFRSRAPQWARILASIGDGSRDRPELTVILPEGTPMDLSLRLSMGESRVDLGGLTLRDLDVDVSMGEHRIDFPSPIVEGVRRLRLNASMGNVNVENLGNARPQSIEGSGSMGNLNADLGGAWEQGSAAQMSFALSMGELRLRVPMSVRLESELRDGDGAIDRGAPDTRETTDPNAPVVKLRVSTSMGESRVVRY